MGFQTLSAFIEVTILPITGMIYMMLLFPSRYTPLKTVLMQMPIALVQYPAILWIDQPNYMQMQYLMGTVDLAVSAYLYAHIFTVPLRSSCAWYYAYCMVSPFSLISSGYAMFSPLGDIPTTDVLDLATFKRFLIKLVITLIVSVIMITIFKRLHDWLPLSQRHLQWIERSCNAFYLFFSTVWTIFLFQESTTTLGGILPSFMSVGIIAFILLKMIFDAAEKQQLVQEHEFLAQQCDLQYRSFQDSLSHEQAIRKFRHDTVGHLQTMHAFLDQRKYGRIEQYAAQLAAQYQNKVQPQVGDRALVDIVVNQYRQICQSRGIQLDCRIKCRLPSADADLMCMIANLLEYHIARCRDTMNASQPLITLELCNQADSLIISCKDTVSSTSRASKEAFRMLAEQARQCGGCLQQEQNATVITVPNGS